MVESEEVRVRGWILGLWGGGWGLGSRVHALRFGGQFFFRSPFMQALVAFLGLRVSDQGLGSRA